jgi:hypothetical protein
MTDPAILISVLRHGGFDYALDLLSSSDDSAPAEVFMDNHVNSYSAQLELKRRRTCPVPPAENRPLAALPRLPRRQGMRAAQCGPQVHKPQARSAARVAPAMQERTQTGLQMAAAAAPFVVFMGKKQRGDSRASIDQKKKGGERASRIRIVSSFRFLPSGGVCYI